MEPSPDPGPRYRPYTSRPRPDRLLAVDGALKAFDTIPEIATRMARRGYDAEELARGRALYEAALGSRGTQATRKGTRLVATAAQNDLLDAAHAL